LKNLKIYIIAITVVILTIGCENSPIGPENQQLDNSVHIYGVILSDHTISDATVHVNELFDINSHLNNDGEYSFILPDSLNMLGEVGTITATVVLELESGTHVRILKEDLLLESNMELNYILVD